MAEPRAAVIGYGFAGRDFHSYLIGLTPGLKLHGISSRSAETRARIVQERSCKAYDSFEAVIADPAVDLVVLGTPHDTHAPMAIQAMEAGKHVVTDKVMCLNVAECEQMIATSERTGRFLGVFHNRRWDGDFLTVKQLLNDGKLGTVRWVEMAWQRFNAPPGWRGRAVNGGGRLYDLGAHMLDQILQIFPQSVTSVYCRKHYDFPDHDVESHALVVLAFADGATAVCDASSTAAIVKPRFHLFGTEGAFIKYGLDPQEEAMKAGQIDAAVNDEASYGRFSDGTTETVIPTIRGRWRSYYENVRDVLTQGAESAIKLSEMRRLMAVLDAAHLSAEIGQPVEPK